MRHFVSSAFSVVGFCLFVLLAPIAHAQITGSIEADIHHRFIVADATLPPGHYIFRMSNSDQKLMTVTSADGNTGVEFLVRKSIDSHTPRHTELIFNRYGDKEFLTHVYEIGDKTGVAVVLTSREEERLRKSGKTPFEHTEEQVH